MDNKVDILIDLQTKGQAELAQLRKDIAQLNNPVNALTEDMEHLKKQIQDVGNKSKDSFDTLSKKVIVLRDLANSFKSLTDGIRDTVQVGIDFDKSMHELQAVAGVSGKTLADIGVYAREAAKAFGTDASTSVESYKLLLSQLGPELAKTPRQLQEMGNAVQTTAKLMGNDVTAAAEVLTTAMNQYGISLEDPIKATATMKQMMNAMAAAGQAGSAELPQIANALKQSGMAANSAGVKFNELNAAIQVLDKAGKKGSEGGVAIRNILGSLAKNNIGNNSMTFAERLKTLKPLLKDDAALIKMFGVENANAARALIEGTSEIDKFNKAIEEGVSAQSASTQAEIIMNSISERQAKMSAIFNDFKIDVQQAFGSLAGYVGGVGDTVAGVVNMVPGIMSTFELLKKVAAVTKQWSWFTKIQIGLQKVLNIAMKGLPIFWIVTALTVVADIVYTIYKHFDSIRKAFADGGILAGVKRIGQVLLESILLPLQKLFETIGFKGTARSIQSLRESWGFAEKPSTNDELANSVNEDTKKTTSTPSAVTAGLSSAAKGGTRSTSINIKLDSMVGTIAFNGGVKENSESMIRQVEEALLRTLYSARSAAM